MTKPTAAQIARLVQASPDGLTIGGLVALTGASRAAVRAALTSSPRNPGAYQLCEDRGRIFTVEQAEALWPAQP